MKRARLGLMMSLLAVAGCWSPVSVKENSQANSICHDDEVFVAPANIISSATPNPWNRHAGVLIYLPEDDGGATWNGLWNLYGVDSTIQPQDQQIVWMMFDATEDDRQTLLHYRESGWDCGGAASNPGGGSNDPPPPDPDLHGARCVPKQVWTEATKCEFLRGCSPKLCSDIGKCGSFDDGCGRTVSCGCPSNDICGYDGVCRECKPTRRCTQGMCGEYEDGCGGEYYCGGKHCFLQ